jgi:putative YpdA family bacillithiol system oxidoreductase
MRNFQVIIIGGGPIGIACALECEKRGWHYTIIEKGALTNSIYNYPLNMRFFSTSEKLELDSIPFISNQPKPNRDEALEYYRRVVTANNLTVKLFETVETVEKDQNKFIITTDKNQYLSEKVIIASGFYDIPKMLNVPGEHLPKVSHYFTEAHPYILQKVAIIGASNSAVDAALEIWRKGGEITMIVRGEAIGERVKYWVRPDIVNRIAEGSIKAYYNAEVTNIDEKSISFKTPEEEITIENDFVLALTGYRPNLSFLKNIGIQLSDDDLEKPFYNESTMETNVEGLYLAGVICGGQETHKWFIENSRVHAKLIAQHLDDIFIEGC